ncbi:hypothetical protein HC891_26755 [Candidatus Gracilibacteria bacterium]|nr:hypothetical protein [Candidatus Gracilibacteria bacterium]
MSMPIRSPGHWPSRATLPTATPTRSAPPSGGPGSGVMAIEVSGRDPMALQQAIDNSPRWKGRSVVASWYGSKPVNLDLGGHFHRGRVRLRSSQVGRVNPELGARWDIARRHDTIVALLQDLRLRELISHRFTLYNAAAAYQVVARGEALQAIFVYESTEPRA